MYPMPSWQQLQTFRLLLPYTRYPLLSENHMAHKRRTCKEDNEVSYCRTTIVKNIEERNCEANIILKWNVNNCNTHELIFMEVQAQQIANAAPWLLIIPISTETKIICKPNQEISTLLGSYLINIKQTSCKLGINQVSVQSITTTTYRKPLLLEFSSFSIVLRN